MLGFALRLPFQAQPLITPLVAACGKTYWNSWYCGPPLREIWGGKRPRSEVEGVHGSNPIPRPPPVTYYYICKLSTEECIVLVIWPHFIFKHSLLLGILRILVAYRRVLEIFETITSNVPKGGVICKYFLFVHCTKRQPCYMIGTHSLCTCLHWYPTLKRNRLLTCKAALSKVFVSAAWYTFRLYSSQKL